MDNYEVESMIEAETDINELGDHLVSDTNTDLSDWDLAMIFLYPDEID